ncbi:cobyric acid synthase [Amycolatopsis sp. CA-230715]|uniref:cobyric acid synthase n=1 Tax=Amycolatopsis sp. CA-230715 TaxID=2745196 RepID=UPI001C012FD8|nr:cobyric acid synthase [Amycolatopsis sp. CA-230715]QWF78339.1 Cobyric acid synthase [Amycolatopsis sp. CA-230715]
MSGVLVAGTTSDAGKSLVAAGLCRWLAREGVRVAPFKAQNMSNNSMVCADGAEIGRAQWLQARAAGVEPEAAFNPVLLKPGSDRRSHIVAMGKPFGVLDAGEYATGRRVLAKLAFDAYRELERRFDVVVCEGAGSPAEVNLRDGDYVNMGLAREFGLPVLVVGDIDRGGVLAAMYGTLALLDHEDQELIAGWVVNKFRGDLALLRPGLGTLTERTGRPVFGVLPWLDGVWIDSEDALAAAGWAGTATGATLKVAVVRFPRASNATDVDALAAEPGVAVSLTADPDVVATSDVVVLPGSRATVSDLRWLAERGLADAVKTRAVEGKPVLGVCGGYQMLATRIADDVESEVGTIDGLGLLPSTVDFTAEKVLATPEGRWRGHAVRAYEIHHGRATVPETPDVEPFLDGCRRGPVWGTMWHGAFDNDGFRRAWLTEAAAQAGIEWTPRAGAPGFAELRERMLDSLADAIEQHLDGEALRRLMKL